MKQCFAPNSDGGHPLALLFVLTVSLAAVVANPAFSGEEPPISVKAEVNRAFITIGDPVEYVVTVKHDPSIQILSNIPTPSANIFKVKKIEDIRREEDSVIVEGKKFVLTTFRLGEFILDPVTVQYRVGDKDPQKIETNRLFITVKSVAEGEEKVDIRGVKSVIGLPRHFLGIFILLTSLAALLAGYGYYRFWRKPPEATQAPESVLSPEEQALKDLSRLFDRTNTNFNLAI